MSAFEYQKNHTKTIAWRETISTDYIEAEKVKKTKQNTHIGKSVTMEEQQQQTVVESDL